LGYIAVSAKPSRLHSSIPNKDCLAEAWKGLQPEPRRAAGKVYKIKSDLQPGSLTFQVAGEHQPYRKHPKGLQEKGLQSRSATASLLIKKGSVHAGRNIAHCFPGPGKQTHCLTLRHTTSLSLTFSQVV